MPRGLRSPTPNPARVLVSPGVPLPDPPGEERRSPPEGTVLPGRESAHSPPERRATAGAGEHGIKSPQERMADCLCLGP